MLNIRYHNFFKNYRGAKIMINANQKVEYYFNDDRLWTTSVSLDPALNNKLKFYYSGHAANGYSYADNLTIVPEPAAISLLSLGALPLLRRRK